MRGCSAPVRFPPCRAMQGSSRDAAKVAPRSLDRVCRRWREQERDQVRIVGAAHGQVLADAAASDAPAAEFGFLQAADVFVENKHATGSARAARAMWRTSALVVKSEPARCTASAMASRVTEPRHASQISSQFSPRSMARKTCQTMTREPLNVGLPWQMPLSATMYLPSSTRLRAGVLALAFMAQRIAETRPGARREGGATTFSASAGRKLQSAARRTALHPAGGLCFRACAVKSPEVLGARVFCFAARVAHGRTFIPSPFAAARCRSSKL